MRHYRPAPASIPTTIASEAVAPPVGASVATRFRARVVTLVPSRLDAPLFPTLVARTAAVRSATSSDGPRTGTGLRLFGWLPLDPPARRDVGTRQGDRPRQGQPEGCEG
jgi:hypothetical protein